MNWSLIRTLLIGAVVVAILIFALRSCKSLDIKQRSNDKKATLSVEIEKEKPKDTKNDGDYQ